jgi:microcompartment protein CcmL/EutN
MNPIAIAAVETSSIAQGVVVADAMLKQAEVELLAATTTSPGRFWVLVGGAVAPVRAAHARGIELAADTVIDQLLLPQLDAAVLPAIHGVAAWSEDDAVGVIESLTAASAIVAADTAVKSARVRLRRIRLADGIGGKGVVLLSGLVHDVQEAVRAGREDAQRRGLLARAVVVPRIDPGLRQHLFG